MLTGPELKQKIEDLFGHHGSIAHFSRALGKAPSHLHRIFAGSRNVPEDLVAIVELLESSKPDRWPERWRRD